MMLRPTSGTGLSSTRSRAPRPPESLSWIVAEGTERLERRVSVDQGGNSKEVVEEATEEASSTDAAPVGWKEWSSYRSRPETGDPETSPSAANGSAPAVEVGTEAVELSSGSGLAQTIAVSGTRRSSRRWRYKPKHHHGPSPVSAVLVAVAALAGGLIGGAVVSAWHATQTPGAVQVTVVHGSPGPALADGSSIPDIASKALNSVVTITATGPTGSVLGGGQSSLDEGTGMIIDTQGDILTNNHVIAGSVAVSVTLHGSVQSLAASVVGTDLAQDIALIRISNPPTGLVPVIFGDSGQLIVGDAVVAIGDALGLSAATPTVTSGIVSALGRTVQAEQATMSGTSAAASDAPLLGMIQTDAPINPGNSGGPLLDSAGRVVGMNTAVVSSNPDDTPAQDIGFAIPSNRLISALASLERNEQSQRAMLGVEVISNSAALRSQYGLAVTTGAVVVAVDSGSPADVAGVRVGDVIVGFDSRSVTTSEDLQNDVERDEAGQQVSLRLWRAERELTVRPTLESATAAS
jgi:S1-C subfamily serine protease